MPKKCIRKGHECVSKGHGTTGATQNPPLEPLGPATIAAEVLSTSSIRITQTAAATGGTGAVTFALYRHTASFTPPGTGTLVATSLPFTDTGLSADTAYYYEGISTDGLAATANTNEVSGTTNAEENTDEPLVADATGLIFVGNASNADYADLTAAGALPAGGGLWNYARLLPFPAPATNYILTGSSTPIDTTRNEMTTGKGGTGKALKNIQPTSSLAGTPGSFLYIAGNFTMPPRNSQVVVRHQMLVEGNVTNTVAIKGLQFKLFGPAGGAQPQFTWHNMLPLSGLASAEQTYFQFYTQGYEDIPANGSSEANQSTQPNGPYLSDIVNTWVRVTYSYKPHTSSAIKDGHARMWIDGTKVMDTSQSAVGVTPVGGEKTWCTQRQVDMLHADYAYGDAYCLIMLGGDQTETPNVSPTSESYNIGNGDETNLDTFAVWYVN
jgi:hypothetical protein